jgi:hypothetical protein
VYAFVGSFILFSLSFSGLYEPDATKILPLRELIHQFVSSRSSCSSSARKRLHLLHRSSELDMRAKTGWPTTGMPLWLKTDGNGRETPAPVPVTTFSDRKQERERDSRLYDNG